MMGHDCISFRLCFTGARGFQCVQPCGSGRRDEPRHALRETYGWAGARGQAGAERRRSASWRAAITSQQVPGHDGDLSNDLAVASRCRCSTAVTQSLMWVPQGQGGARASCEWGEARIPLREPPGSQQPTLAGAYPETSGCSRVPHRGDHKHVLLKALIHMNGSCR